MEALLSVLESRRCRMNRNRNIKTISSYHWHSLSHAYNELLVLVRYYVHVVVNEE